MTYKRICIYLPYVCLDNLDKCNHRSNNNNNNNNNNSNNNNDNNNNNNNNNEISVWFVSVIFNNASHK